jgi:hypothetical protein
MMMMDVGTGGDWARAFSGGPIDRFGAPMVEDVDFPKLGLAQAWNDMAGKLQ